MAGALDKTVGVEQTGSSNVNDVVKVIQTERGFQAMLRRGDSNGEVKPIK